MLLWPVGSVTATSTFETEVGDAVTSSASWDEHSLDLDVIVLAAGKTNFWFKFSLISRTRCRRKKFLV